jgi:hypothetical protein
MKAALIIARDMHDASVRAAPLKLLGYIPVIAKNAGSAAHFFKVTGFDLVIIHQPTLPNDRRSLAGEIKRAQRTALVILATDCDAVYAKARTCCYSGLTAVLREPVTYKAMWRIVEYERDGFGCHPGWVPASEERRVSLPFSADY